MSTTRHLTAPAPDTGGRLHALTALVSDPTMDPATKRARLQGWRGADLERAVAAGGAQRLGPAVCGSLALVAAVTGSTLVLLVTLATAAVGVVAANHPVETLYNRIAARRARPQLPANRAAKRLGCALGTTFLGGAWIAAAVGSTALSTVLLVQLGGLALFVAATGICVPSIVFTLLFGADAGTRRHLVPSTAAR